MGVHDISGSGGPDAPRFDPPPRGETEAVVEAWRQVLAADARVEEVARALGEALTQLEQRRRHVRRVNQVAGVLAATTRVESLGSLAMDVLGAELGARRGAFFALEGATYAPVAALGAPLGSLVGYVFPAPNPFPEHPLVLFQSQWLEDEVHRGSLLGIRLGPGDGLYFIPFEHQLFLMGFAVLSLPKERAPGEPELELLEVLQHLFAIALNNAWLFRDLQQQRTELALQAGVLREQAAALGELQAASHLGQVMKDEFLAFASQEMARQLEDMLNLLRLGQGGAYTPSEAGSAFEEAFYIGQHMRALLSDLTALVRHETQEIRLEPVEVGDLLHGLIPRLLGLPRRPGGEILWPAPMEGAPPLLADAEVLSLVLLHLLHSALYHAPGLSIDLALERTPVSLCFRVPLQGVDLRHAAKAVRKPDPSGEDFKVEGHAGAALSLYVCRTLLERMGASLQVQAGAARSELVIEVPVVMAE